MKRVVVTLLALAIVHTASASDKIILDAQARYEQQLIDAALLRDKLIYEPNPDGKTIEFIQIDASKIILPTDYSLLKKVPIFTKYEAANYIHVRTRDKYIAKEMLIGVGEIYQRDKVEESARNLRALIILAVARIVTVKGSAPDRIGLLVVTKDEWSLRLNTNFTADQSHVDTFDLSLQETNLAGRNKTASVEFGFDPGRYITGAAYSDPRIWLSRHAASLTSQIYFNRATGKFEGGYGDFNVGRPLFSLRTKWAWNLDVNYLNDKARLFQGANIELIRIGYDIVPFVYDRDVLVGTLAGTYSMGVTHKSNFTIGVTGNRSLYGAGSEFPAQTFPYTKQTFLTLLPRSERAVGPYVQYDYYLAKYITLRNIDTFALTEDVRLGPAVTLILHYAVPGLNSHYFSMSGSLSSAHYAHDNLFYYTLTLSGRFERGVNQPGILVNQAASILVHEATPLFAHMRLHLSLQTTLRNRDLNNTREALGLSDGLRGFAPREFIGNDYYLANAELRTTAISLWTMHVGAVAFYDGGDAPPDLRTLHWHQDAGVGLRVLFPQFSRPVLRFDIAFPFERSEGGYAPQFSAAFNQAF